MGHISRSFKVATRAEVDPSQESILPPDWSMIDVPIPGLPIILGFKCTSCGWLLGRESSFKCHYKSNHKETSIPDFSTTGTSQATLYSRVYVQKIFPSSTHVPPLFPPKSCRCYYEVIHVPETVPQHQPSKKETHSSLCLTHIPVTTLPPYISVLGWLEWLQSTQLSPQFLQWLVTAPLNKATNTYQNNQVLAQVEHGLWETSELLKEYLKAADEKLSSMTPGIRDAIRGQ